MLKLALTTALLCGFASPALAAPSAAELRHELRADHKVLRDQKQDLRELKNLKDRWARATAHQRSNELARIDKRLDTWMGEELRENQRARVAAKQEFLATGGDEAALSPPVRARYGKVRQVVTPPRAQDDLQDFVVERGHADQTREIVEGLRGMQPAFAAGVQNEALIHAKANLIHGLEVGAQRDVKRAQAELAEDKAALARRR